jgi:Domain of unknown function (DUF4430)
MIRRVSTALAAAAAVAAGGCGLGPGAGTSNVSVTVTQSFGAKRIGYLSESKVPGSQTVMRMLERSFRVATRYGGGFVESIDGRSGSSAHLDWFYYVNGIEASQGAAATSVHRGDRIWWDLHDWSETDSIPAVVGSFPEPFLHGSGGRRYPTALECANAASTACKVVGNELSKLGVPVAEQFLGTGSGTDSLTVVVGPWSAVGGSIAGALIEQGPRSSGVYAKFSGAGGSALELLNPHGALARTLTGSAGMIAATSESNAPPTWLVTGTDSAGVTAAADAFTPAALDDHFALAVQDGVDLPVPQQGAS